MSTIRIVVSSQYGRLSRGRHSARRVSGHEVQWAERDALGRLVITEPGIWLLHAADGFQRAARATLTVQPDGNWKMSGDVARFDVVDE